MQSLILLIFLFVISCVPSPKTIGEKTAKIESEGTISLSAEALKNSAPIANSILAEKDLLIRTNNPSIATKAALNQATTNIAEESAAKAEEEFIASKTIINCTLTQNVTNCAN